MRARRPLILALLVVGVAGWFQTASAVGPDYRIDTDDVLGISVWDQKDLDQVVTVRPDGKISLPLVGEIEAGGLTVAELSSRLNALYSRVVRGAQVTVRVLEMRSHVRGVIKPRLYSGDAVYVMGEVKTPGQVKYTKDLTITTAIAAAGGFTPLASPRRVMVMRKTVMRGDCPKKEVFRIDVNEIMSDPDFALKPNDIVIVPQSLF